MDIAQARVYTRTVMHIDWKHVLTAVGLALVFEGLPYFAWAERMPAYLRLMSRLSPANLRRIGIAAMLGGLLVVYLAQR